MRGSIRRGGVMDWSRALGPAVVYLPYLRRQLWRKGLRHPLRLLEGLDVAVQHVAYDRLLAGGLPTDWRAWRPLLDRAIYRAICELRPCGTTAVDPESLSSDDGDRDEDQAAAREEKRVLIDRVNRLPVAQRLIVKLKWAALFYPVDVDIDLAWQADEAEFLREKHPGRTLESLDAEFRERVRAVSRRQRGKVPSAAIAWLLGRAGADAVDTAFGEIMRQLGDAAPPGAVLVSKSAERRTAAVGSVVALLTGERRPTDLNDLAYGTPSASRRFLRSATNSFWTDV